jgi:hypothetical protein
MSIDAPDTSMMNRIHRVDSSPNQARLMRDIPDGRKKN